jgi:hypothetical protein
MMATLEKLRLSRRASTNGCSTSAIKPGAHADLIHAKRGTSRVRPNQRMVQANRPGEPVGSRDKSRPDEKYALSPFLAAPLASSSFRIPPLIGVVGFVSTSLDTTSFVLRLCLKIASLGQGFPEHRVQLHTILGESGRAKQNANQNGGSRNSNCRASASRHCCASLKSESGLPPSWDDPPIALVTSNGKVFRSTGSATRELEMTRIGTDEAPKTKRGGTKCDETPHENKQARPFSERARRRA